VAGAGGRGGGCGVRGGGDWRGRLASGRDRGEGGVGPGRDMERGASAIQRAVSRGAENIRGRWRGVMTRLTRREFLRTSASGAGLALLAAGCGPAIKGDFAPKTGRRVVVIGGGWGGATAAKYLRLADAS